MMMYSSDEPTIFVLSMYVIFTEKFMQFIVYRNLFFNIET